MKRVLSVLVAAAIASGCAAATKTLPPGQPIALGFSPEGLAAIAPALQAYVDSGKLSGITAVITRHGQIAYEQEFGWSDLNKKKPLERDDVFRIYSMTKPITSAAVMRLVDQGKLSLDDPVSKFIPGFANVKVFAGGSADQPILRDADSPMTIRQVLTHMSGLAYGTTSSPVDTIFKRAKMYDAAYTTQFFADSLAHLPLVFSPGTGWNYSSGIDLAGRIVEVASGKPLDRFFQDELFTPLGMKHTGFRKKGYLKHHLTKLYQKGPDGSIQEVGNDGLQAMYDKKAKFFWGSGGLLSTIDDYLRFTQMLLNHGVLDGVRVLSDASVTEMTRNQLPASLIPIPMGDRGYGFGLAMSVLVDTTVARRPGPAGIYRWSGYVGTYFWNDPRNDMTAMVWTQFSPGSTYPLERDFQKLVYSALLNTPTR